MIGQEAPAAPILDTIEQESAMARDPKIVVRTMSLEKAKKLVRKISAEHAELFRRLAQ